MHLLSETQADRAGGKGDRIWFRVTERLRLACYLLARRLDQWRQCAQTLGALQEGMSQHSHSIRPALGIYIQTCLEEVGKRA